MVNGLLEIPVATEEVKGGSVKTVNDTDEDIRIHTGSGHVKLNHGGGLHQFVVKRGERSLFLMVAGLLTYYLKLITACAERP